MVVLHVLNAGRPGGIASLVLPAVGRLGARVEVAMLVEERLGKTARTGVDVARAHGLIVHEIVVRRRADAAAVRALAELLLRLRPTIAHAHDAKPSVYLACAARAAKSRVTLVSTHHGIHGRPDGKTRLYERIYRRAVLPGFDRVLAVSEADQRELVGKLGAAKVRLHRNGVDARLVPRAERARLAAELRRAWGLEGTEPLVGVVGRLSPEKRHERAFAAIEALAPELPARLVVFGSGPREEQLRARADAMRLGDRVVFAGFRPRVGDELAGLDVLLSLSEAEGLPVNLIEAGWAATPVVATDVGGVAEVLGRPPAGVLVPRDAHPQRVAYELARLLGDAARRAKLGAALQERVTAGFSRDAWLARLAELYAEVTAHPAGTTQPVDPVAEAALG